MCVCVCVCVCVCFYFGKELLMRFGHDRLSWKDESNCITRSWNFDTVRVHHV